MKKKIVSLFVFTLLFIVSQNSHAYNTGDSFSVGGFTYEVTNPATYEVCVTGISLNDVDVTIPAKVFDGIDKWFTVTSVGKWTDAWSRSMKTLTVPEGVLSVRAGAFCNASGLETINLPASLKEISSAAFTNLSNLKEIIVNSASQYFCSEDGILYNKNKTRLISYPTAKSLTDGMFQIPDGVIAVDEGAFFMVSGLKKVNVPQSVRVFRTGNYNAFFFCPNLTDIVVDDTNPYLKDIDGVLCDKSGETLILYPEGKGASKYTIPDGIKNIDGNCFCNSKFSEVDLNDVTDVKWEGFNGCYNLQIINIPSGLNYINDGAFHNCANVTRYNVDESNANYADIDGVLCNKDKTTILHFPVGRGGEYVVPQTITTIADDAFYNSKLTKVIISKNVTTIGKGAFQASESLADIEFEEPAQIETLGESCLNGCFSLENITLPASLKTIGELAFYHCSKLKTVTVADNSQLNEIKRGAFADCTAMNSFNFAGSCALTLVGEKAFARVYNLKYFDFPASVVEIGQSAFTGCSSMTSATFADNAAIELIGRNAFDNSGLESIELPASVKTIETEAFKNCDKLLSVYVPDGTSDISSEAFKYCRSLVDIEVSKGNATYSSVDGMLLSKDKETLMIFPAGKANDKFTLLPPSITKIGDYAFYDCANLKNVTIPNKVTEIGERAFGLCANLNTIAFLCDEMIDPAKINQALNTKSFDDNMFEDINISVRKEKILDYQNSAFYHKFAGIAPSFTNGKEEYIAVSDNAVDLLSTMNGDYTYMLPSAVNHGGKTYSVALIGDYAFQNVTSTMKEVVVPKSVSYIGAKAFRTDIDNNTSTIESIFFLDTNPGTGTLSTLRFNLDDTGNDYGEFAGSQKIYVKKSVVDIYRSVWEKYKNAIDYKVPGISISKKYGTFAREFDTYIGEYAEAEGSGGEVMAFIGGDYRKGNGDYGPETEYHVHMESVNAAGFDGLYIPKNTGVLLKVMDAEATPAGYYYCIGEKDDAEYNVGTNAMKPVTINNQTVSGTDKWVIQQGQFRALNGQTAQMPVHRAYLQLDGVAASSKIFFSFNDGSTTAIGGIEAEMDADAVYYNLNGMHVSKPAKGIYICNGKKVVIK